MAVRRCGERRLSEREGLRREGSGTGRLCVRVAVSWKPLKLRLSSPCRPGRAAPLSLSSFPPLSLPLSLSFLPSTEIHCSLPPSFPPASLRMHASIPGSRPGTLSLPSLSFMTPIEIHCSFPPSPTFPSLCMLAGVRGSYPSAPSLPPSLILSLPCFH